MSDLPQGPLPVDCEESVFNIIRDVGVSVLTLSVLRKRLAAKYKIDFSPHDSAVEAAVQNYLSSPEGLKELAKVRLAKAEGPVGGKGKKRARSPKESGKESKKEKNGKSKKVKKPDDYPKAALSAYFIFGNQQREKIKMENVNMVNTEIIKEVGRRWADLSEEEKGNYKKLAEADKARFDTELKAYIADGGQMYKRGKKDGKSSKGESKGPKRPSTSFIFFSKDFRIDHPELSMIEQTRQAGMEWKKLSDEDKKPFELKAAQDKERYNLECQQQGLKTKSSNASNAAVMVDDTASSSDDSSSSGSDGD
ncbi:unnamed protein product [Phytomonas sp. Hart1]|nr:unnamed protein product [Phytomonas sp. Hart1]|eukprot:CCW67414.1 unnamed protein product [Phytomonas sp. isolate Hart1]